MTPKNNETVLIVDDNPVNLGVVAEVLTEIGYNILVAEDGLSAIELANKALPDIILLDITMPQMDGFEVCQRLKSSEATREIPVLFLTALSDSSSLVKGFESGAVDYITKPYKTPEVLARVSTHLTIARQKRELANLLCERERFMSIAAHDLRNPLSVITWRATFGLDETVPGEIRNYFLGIKKSAFQMNTLIEDFLTLQTIRKGLVDGKTVFQLQELLEQVIEQQTFAAKRKNITIVLEPTTSDRPVRGHTPHVHQILSNFLSNAIKYSPLQTQVLISARLVEENWRIEFVDQGPGIPEGERSKVFVEFAKFSAKPTAGETSTGLGLAIVKKLAEAMDGRVGVTFPEAGGSNFWVELPAGKAGESLVQAEGQEGQRDEDLPFPEA